MTRRLVRGHAEFGERQKGAASVAPAVETREGEGEFVGRAQPGDDGAEDAVGEDLPCPLFVFRITRTVDAFLRHLINMQPVPGTVSISSNYFVEHDPPQSPHSRKRLSRANLVRRKVWGVGATFLPNHCKVQAREHNLAFRSFARLSPPPPHPDQP